jgi:hypothetical protein
MPERLLTHLRHLDLAVPDHDGQVEFYTRLWGLTPVAGDTGITYLAAEGSPEQYILRLRASADKRLDLISFGAADRSAVDRLAQQLAADSVQLVSEPGTLATPGGGYGFRFFDVDGRTIEVSCDVAARRHRKIEEGESIPVKLSHVVVNTFSYFLDPHGNTVEYTTELEVLDEDAWHPHLLDITQPEVADQWGTANPMSELVAAQSFNDPDPGVFVAPPA